MNYEQALNFIHSLDKFGSRPGLDRVQKLFDSVPGVLDQSFIHVAGTNGKGSVCAVLSSALRQAGYRTGLFISPYITDFRERIQIDNEMISEDELIEAVEHFKPILDRLNSDGVIITEFELLTVMSFWIFKRQKCGVIVCEVGMGGLLDSTNLIPSPLCSVITRVDLDHTAVLGDTIEEIAAQKSGIIKQGCITVTAAQRKEAYSVIEATARAKNNRLYRGEDTELTVTGSGRDGTRLSYRGTDMLLPLIGAHQIDNLRCALAAVEALNTERGFSITTENIRDGLAELRHPARFERLRQAPDTVLDGAHNPNGLGSFADAVRAYYPDGEKTLIIGMLADKDSTSLYLLGGLFDRIIATDIHNPRALPAEELAQRLSGIAPDIEVVSSPQRAYDKALTYGSDIFICGSLYLASELRPYIIDFEAAAKTRIAE